MNIEFLPPYNTLYAYVLDSVCFVGLLISTSEINVHFLICRTSIIMVAGSVGRTSSSYDCYNPFHQEEQEKQPALAIVVAGG